MVQGVDCTRHFTPSHPHFSLQPLLWQSVLCRLQPASCRLQFNGTYIMYIVLYTSCFLCWDFSGPEAHGCWQKPTRQHTRATQQCVVVKAARPHLTNRARKAVGWCWPLALSERRVLRCLSPRTLPKPNPTGLGWWPTRCCILLPSSPPFPFPLSSPSLFSMESQVK